MGPTLPTPTYILGLIQSCSSPLISTYGPLKKNLNTRKRRADDHDNVDNLKTIQSPSTSSSLKDGLKRHSSNLMDSATDVDNNGTIDYDEFIATTVHMSKLEREEHLLTAFTAARQAQTWSTLVSTTSSEEYAVLALLLQLVMDAPRNPFLGARNATKLREFTAQD
ncbi:hypothetical protein SORBI_3001G283900 [Sorghum bicolor]|uniref:EF-hand domain-containing protein n=2 Tax=Sorghum bicolor TaxID=4558 RepID=A0A1B6QLL6_SORBI|nr:hypothetical protein SORBI_3001G283900 [Sorghum bicolor]